jgi:5'-3' exonuclease
LPIRSFHLLPPEYLPLTQGILNEYFPLDFDVDLNGKTLAWEAIVLIPFVAEVQFLAEEKKLFEAGYRPTEADKIRNVAAFEIFSYNYRAESPPEKLIRTTLTNFTTPIRDFSQVTLLSEYEKVGQMTFESKLLKGVVQPSPGYPSFAYLGITQLE